MEDGLILRNEHERAQLRERLAAGRDEEISDEERRRQNKGFAQVYPRGWARMRALAQESKSPAPLMIYTFIAEHSDPDGGILVVDQETLVEALGISRTTVWRACKFLEDTQALLRLKVGGSVYAYALNPNEVWKSWDSAKETAVFNTKTMVKKSMQTGDIKRRMMLMIKAHESQADTKSEGKAMI